MTEQDHVTVNDPRGAVNTGAGHQYVFYGVGADWMARKGVAPLRIIREDRERLADRFVRPVRYRVAAERLEKPGSVVLLAARPGSGRRAAAIMLLHELGDAGDADEQDVRFDELDATDEEDLAPREGDRFLCDLSALTDEEEYARAQSRLAAHRSRIQQAGARMVVVLPAGLEHAHSPDLEPLTVTLGRPRSIAVVTRNLRMDRMVFGPADLRDDRLQALFDHSPMRELARLAGLVRAARDSGRFGDDFAKWLAQAVHAVTDRADEVGRQVTGVRATPDRALLLTAAMFEKAHTDTVYEAWRGLIKRVGDEEETTKLPETDFGERLTTLGIERDPDGRLRFGPLAYADAVRTYFWTNFPGTRNAFKDWIGEAAGLRGLTTDNRMSVVVRFSERCLATGRPEDLFDLVVHWAEEAPKPPGDRRAVTALELGLSHERFGPWFRRRMYGCAAGGPLSDGLLRVLTAVCVQTLATTHPDQALVRLHHLSVREGPAAREAREALLNMAGGDRRHYGSLIERLHRSHRDAHTAAPQLRLLTDLLSSERAPEPPPWSDLFLGWKTVFSRPPAPRWKPLVHGWLDAVTADGTRDRALDVMVRAAGDHPAALHRLFVLAHEWAGPARDPSRAATAARFWRRIDHAQYARTRPGGRTGTGPRTTEEA